jgi:predicted  nucleic acid-binding Zn-ribbon protein
LAGINALATPEEKVDSLTAAITALFDNKQQLTDQLTVLQKKYDALEDESTVEIERLSKELSFATSKQGKANLSVTVGGQKYTTAAGRKYNINGKIITVEDLVQDEKLCAQLVSAKSGIFQPVAE